MSAIGKARRWAYRCLLASELIVVVLLITGGCYSKQNYRVLSPQKSDELLDKCEVVVEGRVVNLVQNKLRSWQQRVFCYPLSSEEPEGPDRYTISIDVEKILKGDPNMPRRLQVDNFRPPTSDEIMIFTQGAGGFSDNMRLRIGYSRHHGNSYRNLIVVPLLTAPATQPH